MHGLYAICLATKTIRGQFHIKDLSTRSASSVRRLHCTWLIPIRGLFRWRGRFRLERVDALEEGRRPQRGVEAPLMYLDSLRLPSCARNPHISSGRSGAQQTIECREARRCPTQPQLT
ncbi:hypothetical protein M9H77_26756 [Catharanthus roseus]|uniref:Uncharacterized protein n=1 Tax=Catharanthus roseus TaxID=4058 RepID=A0ACC0ADA2_CATRO|nr:hypothetical protein M9H77_26756 [Catharanthus roseus]